jgi:tRNA(Ile)-lysidine synthase
MISDTVTEALRETLDSLPAALQLKIGYSGGRDSHVLLHALRGLTAGDPQRVLSAIHVHHGLRPEADAWEAHCEQACADLDVPLEVVRVAVPAASKSGPEAAARQSRYQAFEARLGDGEVLCLAHHRDDQAETFLLQLLRGAGPEGLSAMPARAVLGKGSVVRPLLEVAPAAIRDYADVSRLCWIDDPSNDDRRFNRNYLRHEVIPILLARWPAAMRTIARAAANQAAVARAAQSVGAQALSGAGGAAETLACEAIARLDPDAARLAVRVWLKRRGFSPPSKALLNRILHEVVGARLDAEPLVAWPGAEVRRYRGALYLMPPLLKPDAGAVHSWDPGAPLDMVHGSLSAEVCVGEGLSAALCRDRRLEVRFRRGGERCRPAGEAHSSSLKACFQRRGIPPWERDRLPLIFLDAELAAVAGQWSCEGFEARRGDPGWIIRWAAACGRRRA